MNRLSPTFAALAVPQFRLLWFGSLLATTAFMTTFVLVPIVAYQITGSYAASGIAQMGMIAQLILGPMGGVFADRYRKKPLVLAGQIVPCVIIVATGLLIVTGRITIPFLFASTFLMGAAFSLMGPARQAWVTDLLPRRLLANGVALQQMSINIAQFLGPTMGSIAVFLFGFDAGYLYLFVAALFVVVIPLTTLLPNTPATPAPEGGRLSPMRQLTDGFHYLRRRPRLRSLWMYWQLIVVCGFAMQTLIPGLLDREFGRDPNDAIIVFAIFGISALLINVPLAGLVSGRFAWPALFATGVLLAIGLWLVGWAPTFALLIGLGAIAGAGRSGVMLVNLSILMSNTRPEYFGRVMSWVMIAFGLQAMLAPVWGGLADAIGGRQTMYIVGLVVLVGTGMMALSWLRTRRLPIESGTAAAAMAGEAPPEDERPIPIPAAAPSPAFSPLFAARLAPVVLMEGQKPRAPVLSGD